MAYNFEAWAARNGAEELDETAGSQGEVISYNISRPMPLRDFLALPEHAKSEYLQTLRRKGGSTRQIADMFGCTPETVLELMKRAGVRAGGRRVDDADVLWAEFIEGYEMTTASAEAPEIPGAAEAEENRGPGPRGSAAPAGGGRQVDGPTRAEESASQSGTGDLSPTGGGEHDGRPPHPSPAATPSLEDASYSGAAGATEMKSSTGHRPVESPQGEGFGRGVGYDGTGTSFAAPSPAGDAGGETPPLRGPGTNRQDVAAELQAFRVVLSGPADGVLARLGIFADLIGSKSVRVTVCMEEEES